MSDDLGFIYGLYEVSRSVLGVNEFWFWNDQEFVPKKETGLPEDFSIKVSVNCFERTMEKKKYGL